MASLRVAMRLSSQLVAEKEKKEKPKPPVDPDAERRKQRREELLLKKSQEPQVFTSPEMYTPTHAKLLLSSERIDQIIGSSFEGGGQGHGTEKSGPQKCTSILEKMPYGLIESIFQFLIDLELANISCCSQVLICLVQKVALKTRRFRLVPGTFWGELEGTDVTPRALDMAHLGEKKWDFNHNGLCEACGQIEDGLTYSDGGRFLKCLYCNLVYHSRCDPSGKAMSIREEDEEAFSYICRMCEEDRCCPLLGPPICMKSADKRKILFTGAYDVNSFTKFSDIMTLDVVTMKWECCPTSGPSPPYAFGHDQGFAYRDTFCTFGWGIDKNAEVSGANAANGVPALSLGFELLYSLDTNTRQWKPPLNLVATEGALCPEPRLGFCLGVYGDHVYIFGGQVGRTYRNDLWTLQMHPKGSSSKAYSWRKIEPTINPSPRSGASFTRVKGLMFLFGGAGLKFEAKKQKIGYLSDVYIFHPDNNEWRAPACTGKAPVCRSGHSALAVGSNLIIFGGCNYRPLIDVSVLHTSSFTWSTPKLTTPQRGRMRPALQVEGDRILVFGGGSRYHTPPVPVNSAEVFGDMVIYKIKKKEQTKRGGSNNKAAKKKLKESSVGAVASRA